MVPEGWVRTTIGSLGRLSTSSVDKKRVADEEPVPLINYMDVYRTTHLRGDLDLMEVTATPAEIDRFRVQIGDILFTPSSETPDDIGHSAVVQDDFGGALHSYHTVRLRPDGDVPLDVGFSGWVANAPPVLRYFATRATGSTRFTLSLSDFRDAPILVPPLAEQRQIAAILGSVDEAIQATQAVIEQTRTVKQGLLQELLTRGIGHSRFKQTEIGEVPEGWEVKPLADVATVQTGVAKGKKDLRDPVRVPYLRVANVQDGFLDLTEVREILVSSGEVQRYRLQPGDVLLTEGGDLDKLGRGDVWRGEIDLCLHQNHVFAVRPQPNALLPEFLAALTGSEYGKRYFLSCAKQTTNLASINSSQLKQFPVLLPGLAEQQAITGALSVINDQERQNAGALAQLQHLKRGLMQDLLTGRVRVGEG